MSLTMDDMLAIVKPHNDKIVAEHKLECALRENARLRRLLHDIGSSTFDQSTRAKVDAEFGRTL